MNLAGLSYLAAVVTKLLPFKDGRKGLGGHSEPLAQHPVIPDQRYGAEECQAKARPKGPPPPRTQHSGQKGYEDFILDSLWFLGPRDNSPPHAGDYWGNFVPQIPNQVLRRFTEEGEVVVDLFSGMGTTLIECRHLGRHGIGIELNPDVAARSEERIAQASNWHNVHTKVLVGDSTTRETLERLRAELASLGKSHADCVIMHPPYHDIIKFSDDPGDLSNAPSVEAFLQMFDKAALNAWELLAKGRYMALVIGDKYAKGEWIPLGFECMEVCRKLGFRLKAINVKDIQGNERGKGKATNLWRYRALKAGTSVFKHEYIMFFQKP